MNLSRHVTSTCPQSVICPVCNAQSLYSIKLNSTTKFHTKNFKPLTQKACDGRPGLQCARVYGAALARARRPKEATYPELSGANGRTRWWSSVVRWGGRWSDECQSFLSQLSKARVRHEPPGIRASARRAWLRRWSSILACCAFRSLALSLLEQRGGLGAVAQMVTHSSSEVVGDDRYSG